MPGYSIGHTQEMYYTCTRTFQGENSVDLHILHTIELKLCARSRSGVCCGSSIMPADIAMFLSSCVRDAIRNMRLTR